MPLLALRPLVRAAFFRPLLLLPLLVGCALQAEGERCEQSNDNADCEPGLECKSLRQLTGASEGAVCCPNSNPSTEICRSQLPDLDTGDDAEPEVVPVVDGGG